jgi:hypothetical protein
VALIADEPTGGIVGRILEAEDGQLYLSSARCYPARSFWHQLRRNPPADAVRLGSLVPLREHLVPDEASASRFASCETRFKGPGIDRNHDHAVKRREVRWWPQGAASIDLACQAVRARILRGARHSAACGPAARSALPGPLTRAEDGDASSAQTAPLPLPALGQLAYCPST